MRKRLLFGLMIAASLLLGAGLLFAQQPAGFVPFPDDIANNIRSIYSVGQAYGNQPGMFSKVGDSISMSVSYLRQIGWGVYDLGAYGYLQPVVRQFSNTWVGVDNAFTRESLAADVGWAAWGALEPELADEERCQPEEKPLECEFRIARPSIALIMFGTNDASYRTAAEFRYDMERIIALSLSWGVIPVLSTFPNRPDTPDAAAALNQVVRDLANARRLPLWDYAAALAALPDEGLAWDHLHPSSPERANQVAVFSAENLQYGYVVRNLTALQILDRVWRTVDPSAGA
ncbi:MAG TPA: SGNH/GDSL hydrolase family protein [Candidatus Limnocylindrales bacterium]|nr:SGNH/GDSL hydrolase family protein [Candidatus Limnocylindrales bacterium]